MQNDGVSTQNDAPESHAPKPCTFHLEQIRQRVHFEKKGSSYSALFCLPGRDTLRHETPAL